MNRTEHDCPNVRTPHRDSKDTTSQNSAPLQPDSPAPPDAQPKGDMEWADLYESCVRQNHRIQAVIWGAYEAHEHERHVQDDREMVVVLLSLADDLCRELDSTLKKLA